MAPPQNPGPARAAARTPISRPSFDITPNFADPYFDPAEFLNDVLPPLTLASPQSYTPRDSTTVSLAELSTQVQSILTQINAQNVRLSNNLTQLTDEILRSGSRLAYEVEVLRGEAIGLSETLTEALRSDIARFVPETIESSRENNPEAEVEGEETPAVDNGEGTVQDPEFITKLRTLNQVRARLEEVVQTFGDSMEWPLPPSETSLTSSFISVSAPEPGSEAQSQEEKGQEVAKNLRAEVIRLLDSNGGGEEGLKAATGRVESLRVLATVWKGTAEEKARTKFVDSLMKMIEDRRRTLENQGKINSSQQLQGKPPTGHRRQESEGPGGGIFKNLQRLREEIYLE